MKIFVYKELEILASVDTKAIGRMGWLEARPLVNGHWIEECRREKDKATSDPGNSTAVGLVPFGG